jgi:hypothetical protein
MEKCPHCSNTHLNTMEQTLCATRPEQKPIMREAFGKLAAHSDYRGLTLRYISAISGKERTDIVLWVSPPWRKWNAHLRI